MRRLLPSLLLLLLPAGSARAARVEVVLPEDAAIHVVDSLPPDDGPRIDCPPLCTYETPGAGMDIFSLRADVDLDPRTNDPPYDIVDIPGCAGTSTLDAPSVICVLSSTGNSRITFKTRYRPILAATVTGTMAGELGLAFITGGPGPGYQGSGASFSCNIPAPTTQTCARHLSPDQPVTISAPSTDLVYFVDASAPCGAQTCDFTLTEDTCITYTYKHNRPPGFPEQEVFGPGCPTGPGIMGSGGGLPPDLMAAKERALRQMRSDLQQALYPCVVANTGVVVFYAGGIAVGPIVGGTMIAAATPQCVSLIQRIIDLQKTYQDPPDPDYQRVAPIPHRRKPSFELPGCKGLPRDEKRFCKRLGTAVRAYVRKVEKVTDVVESLRVTVERASGANDAGDDKALAKQTKAAVKRVKQMETALARKARAGEKLAALLAEQGVTAPVDETDCSEGADTVLGALAEAGLPDAEARSALGPALDPVALDLVTLFPEP
jgi:hypothetical protein